MVCGHNLKLYILLSNNTFPLTMFKLTYNHYRNFRNTGFTSQLRFVSVDNEHSQRKEPLQIETVRLAYNSYEITKSGDDRPPLIIMHGLLGSKQNWNSVSKAIHAKTNRKVIAVDARNHGDSPHHKEHTYFHLAEDVKSLLENLGLSSATVLGHSMGGRAMMLLALKYPHLISSIIVADISPVTASPNLKMMGKYFNIMRKVKINPGESLAKARQKADKILAQQILEKSLRDFLITNLVKNVDGYGWRVNIDALDQNFARHVALFPEQAKSLQYRGPTLFVAGGSSDYIRKTDEPDIKKLFPNAVISFIDGAGHWLHADKPAEFLNIVTEFLKQNK